jgi:hypothetical protein
MLDHEVHSIDSWGNRSFDTAAPVLFMKGVIIPILPQIRVLYETKGSEGHPHDTSVSSMG